MKFVCRQCEGFMHYKEVELVHGESLGITFACPACGNKISMVTNAGETQLVKALGVKLGSSEPQSEPLELTRKTLRQPSPVIASEAKQSHKGNSDEIATAAQGGLAMTDAVSSLKDSLGKCPFANVVAGMKESMDAKGPAVEAVEWSPEALERLERVPEMVRSFAKMMIENMAREVGASIVDADLMDKAKTKFM